MTKVALIVFADTETGSDRGRVVHALETAYEFQAANDEVQLFFDGAGVKWVPKFAHPQGDFAEYHGHTFEAVKDNIGGVCSFCAGVFGVKEEIEALNIPLLGGAGHQSIQALVAQGYQVITF